MRIGDISLYRYLQVNLGLSLPRLSPAARRKRTPPAAAPKAAELTDARLYQVVGYFLRNLPATLGLPPCCVVFLADMDGIIRAAYARDQIKFDYWPLDRHWNGVGHNVAAATASRLLYDAPGESCRPGKRIATQ